MTRRQIVLCSPVRTAIGTFLATGLLHSMERDALRGGVVTLCIGGGRAIALVLER